MWPLKELLKIVNFGQFVDDAAVVWAAAVSADVFVLAAADAVALAAVSVWNAVLTDVSCCCCIDCCSADITGMCCCDCMLSCGPWAWICCCTGACG